MFALGRRIQDGYVLLQRLIDRPVRILHLAAIVVCGCRIGIEQGVTHIDGPEEHLRPDSRQEFLSLHVPGVDRRRLPFHLGDAPSEVIAGEEPDAEGQAERQQEGRSDG